ncbi:MAG: glycosyltransferase family 39 protein [Crocinitomicaceae bacterium]|nr:glycosyltransferase family 39 protein [Crocinitomicaceae bacterium]
MNFPFGIIILILSIIGYWLSWRSFSMQKKYFAVFLLVFIGLILRVYLASDFYLHSWDERYHALVAKNMLGHPFIPTLYENPIFPYLPEDWSGNHIWLHKQPMSLWTIALSFSCFGTNEIALRLPSILMSTFGIFATYKVARHFFSAQVGFIATFLFSINGLIIELTSGRVATDHIDITFMFFILLGVWMALEFGKRKKVIFNVLCGVFIGAAILTKWLPGLIVIPIWIGAMRYYRSFSTKYYVLHFLLLLSVIAVVALPWQMYIHYAFPQEAIWEAQYNRKHLTSALEGQSAPFYYYFEKVRLIFGEMMLLALAFLAIVSWKKRKNPKFWIFAIWIFIPIVFFSFAATKMQGYIMIAAPAIFIIGAYYWEYLKWNKHKLKFKWLASIIMVLIIALPIRYTIERLKPFDQSERNPAWVVQLKQLGQETTGQNGILLNTSHPIEAMFYTNLTAYERLPDQDVLDSLIDRGYSIYINDGENVSSAILDNNNYRIVSIDER